MNGAELITDVLKRHGVEVVFGYVGSAMLKIVDTLTSCSSIQYIQNYHEQASSFAANAYARVKNDFSVLIVTSGPGAINSIAGIVDAYLDSVPMLVITGQDYSSTVKNNSSRQNGFQDLNIISIVDSFTKYSAFVDDVGELEHELEKAIYYATTGRKGPVVIDVPIDIQFANVSDKKIHFSKSYNKLSDRDYDYCKIVNKIVASKRPVLLLGGGAKGEKTKKSINDFTKSTKVPVITTLNGLDVGVDYYGFAGLYGHTYANKALFHSDLIIAAGTRFGQQHVGKKTENYTHADIIHVDIDERELGRVFPNELKINDFCCEFFEKLNSYFSEKSKYTCEEKWLYELEMWKKAYLHNCEVNGDGDGVDPVQLLKKIFDIFPNDAIITADVGQNQMWTAQAFFGTDRRFLSSSGYGSMGFSLPAGIGGSIAFPNRTVLSFMGDGGFQMNMQELEYLSVHNPNLKCFIFNNSTLGLIRDVQRRYYTSNFVGSEKKYYQCPDIRLLAHTYKLNYFRIDNINDNQLSQIRDTKGSCIIEILVNSDSRCLNRYEVSELIEKYDE